MTDTDTDHLGERSLAAALIRDSIGELEAARSAIRRHERAAGRLRAQLDALDPADPERELLHERLAKGEAHLKQERATRRREVLWLSGRPAMMSCELACAVLDLAPEVVRERVLDAADLAGVGAPQSQVAEEER